MWLKRRKKIKNSAKNKEIMKLKMYYRNSSKNQLRGEKRNINCMQNRLAVNLVEILCTHLERLHAYK